ncbi:MAG TPA: acyltransferase family protein, partial [Actinotalea sp.]|nr:acyltransferase family protein [Actinotalea sp.]
RLRDLAAATPPHRDRYVDLLRAAAILVVVVGHWLTTAVTVTDGRLGGVNLLYVVPWAPPVTWLFQVMPVFFLVGGYANAASLAALRRDGGTATAWVRSRALRLLGARAGAPDRVRGGRGRRCRPERGPHGGVARRRGAVVPRGLPRRRGPRAGGDRLAAAVGAVGRRGAGGGGGRR